MKNWTKGRLDTLLMELEAPTKSVAVADSMLAP